MRTVITPDGYEFSEQADGTWVGAMGDVFDYPPDHQYFYHVETEEVVLLPPGEFVACDKLKAFGIVTEPTLIFQGQQLTYAQLAEKGLMPC